VATIGRLDSRVTTLATDLQYAVQLTGFRDCYRITPAAKESSTLGSGQKSKLTHYPTLLANDGHRSALPAHQKKTEGEFSLGLHSWSTPIGRQHSVRLGELDKRLGAALSGAAAQV
jgi:hypothetical protein